MADCTDRVQVSLREILAAMAIVAIGLGLVHCIQIYHRQSADSERNYWVAASTVEVSAVGVVAGLDLAGPAMLIWRTRLFEQIVETNRPRLSGIARVYGRPHAEDLLQEILLQTWRALPRQNNPNHLNTWCYRIALNTGMTWQRKRRHDRSVNLDDEAWASAVAPTAAGNLARQLDRFIQSLGEVDRALMLMLLDDLEYASISEVMRLSEGAIRVRIHRLKKRLAEWEPLDS
jgi:RNA polymerase sigma-70 factor (ECF subfamily)